MKGLIIIQMINDLKRVKIEYNVKRIFLNILRNNTYKRIYYNSDDLKHVKMRYVCYDVKRNC